MSITPSKILFKGGAYCLSKYGRLTYSPAPIARLGEELKETHTCASTSAFTDRDGIVRSAAIDGIRPHWMYSNDDLTTRKLAILLEEQGSNLAL